MRRLDEWPEPTAQSVLVVPDTNTEIEVLTAGLTPEEVGARVAEVLHAYWDDEIDALLGEDS